MITLYGIKNCDTVKKARAWLDGAGVRYDFHDYKASGIDAARLQRWCKQVGWDTLLNRSDTTYRKLAESEKADIDEQKALSLMAAQPTLIKRPVVELGGRLIVGFKPELYAAQKW